MKSVLVQLATLLSAFELTACQTALKKPVITMCIIDYPSREAICGETNQAHLVEVLEPRRIPLSELDRATAFAPIEWERAQNYIHFLEDRATHTCD